MGAGQSTLGALGLLEALAQTNALAVILVCLWLFFRHLHRSVGALLVSMLLSVAFSPAVCKLGPSYIGDIVGTKLDPVTPPVLTAFASLLSVLTASSILMAGGTQGILVCMVGAQVLAKIVGNDALVEAFS